MKCDKCGTPIIPGEDTCRICGTKANVLKRRVSPDIIDLPDDEETISNDLPDLQDIISRLERADIDQEDYENMIYDKVEETELIMDKPQKNTGKEQIELKEMEDKKKILDTVEPRKPRLNKTKKGLKNGKITINTAVIILTLVLFCSILMNICLFIVKGNSKAKKDNTPVEEKVVYSKVSYDNYKITIPSTWIIEQKTNNLLIYDETENWSASMQIVKNANYDDFVPNKDKLVESLGNLKYQFTSNYSKKVDKKEYYLFKGKYYDYSVYVIVTELDDNQIITADLKFKGEVDDILLNDILVSMGSLKEKATDSLFKDNFEFNDISNQVGDISKNQE